jgi:hypothetical protein
MNLQKHEHVTKAILALTTIGLVLVIASQRDIINELGIQLDSQAKELDYQQTTITELNETLNLYNKTFTLLESDQIVKAANMIISQVGLEYFNKYFYDPEINYPEWNTNLTIVTFKHNITIGNYSTIEEAYFSFYPNHIHVRGIPPEDNLQPYTLTVKEAEKKALEAGLFDSPYPLESKVRWGGPADVRPPSGHEERYGWYIKSWKDPPWAPHRYKQVAWVDPINGTVYTLRNGGNTIIEELVDTPEEAFNYGVDGYVKLDYYGLPNRINLTDTTNMTFTIKLSHISYIENREDAKITIYPYNNATYWIQTRTRDKLRNYLIYEPNGIIFLKAGESLNVTCSLIVQEIDEDLSFKKRTLKGIGIGTEKTLIVSNLDNS